MRWLLGGELTSESLVSYMSTLCRRYAYAGFGGMFFNWINGCNDYKPYGSFGNGSAMRVSPIGWYFNNEDEVLKYAKMSANITHNHDEGVKGAQATAISIYLARNGKSKDEIKQYIEDKFGYDLSRKLDDIRPTYHFEVSCQKSVPEAIICFLEGNSTKEAIQLAISLGGDTDTQACIAGSIAEAFYHDCDDLFEETIKQVDGEYPAEFVDTIMSFNKELDRHS